MRLSISPLPLRLGLYVCVCFSAEGSSVQSTQLRQHLTQEHAKEMQVRAAPKARGRCEAWRCGQAGSGPGRTWVAILLDATCSLTFFLLSVIALRSLGA